MGSSVNLGCVFFSSKCRYYEIWPPLENPYHRKEKCFWQCFQYFFLLTYVDGIFQRRTTHIPIGSYSYCKQFQLDKIKSRLCEWKTFGGFWPLGLPKLTQGGILEFRVYDNFCSPHRYLSALCF
jgi:hypothetical protein